MSCCVFFPWSPLLFLRQVSPSLESVGHYLSMEHRRPVAYSPQEYLLWGRTKLRSAAVTQRRSVRVGDVVEDQYHDLVSAIPRPRTPSSATEEKSSRSPHQISGWTPVVTGIPLPNCPLLTLDFQVCVIVKSRSQSWTHWRTPPLLFSAAEFFEASTQTIIGIQDKFGLFISVYPAEVSNVFPIGYDMYSSTVPSQLIL